MNISKKTVTAKVSRLRMNTIVFFYNRYPKTAALTIKTKLLTIPLSRDT